ncbi:MAG: DUF5606 domain-containing protein [Bacteroidia bacterium]|nr:DUF5606 domain-containing protein [Bacteroidia bacterium]
MELSKILSISGRAGLFKVISQAKNAVIVESLIDQKRIPAFGHEKMSSLEEISVFSTGEDLPLKEVFKKMHDLLQDKETVDPKSGNKVLQDFFLEMVPEYDQERVYPSDIKKILNWYNLLLRNQLLDFSGDEEKEEPSEDKNPDQVVKQEMPESEEKQPSGKKITKK